MPHRCCSPTKVGAQSHALNWTPTFVGEHNLQLLITARTSQLKNRLTKSADEIPADRKKP